MEVRIMKHRMTEIERARSGGEGGFILVIALLLTMLVALLGAAFLSYIPYELRRTAEMTGRDVALQAADAGVQDVIQHLIQDVLWNGYANPTDPIVLTDDESGKPISAYVLNVQTGVDSLDQNLSPRVVMQGITLGYDASGMKRIGVIATGFKLDQSGNIRMKDGSPDPGYARRIFGLIVTASPTDYALYTGGTLTLANGATWNGKIHANGQLEINNYSTVPGEHDTIYLNATVSSPNVPQFGGEPYAYTGPSDPRIVSTASPAFMNTGVLPMPYLDLSDDGPFMRATQGNPDSGYYSGGLRYMDRWSENNTYGLWLGELSQSDFFAQSCTLHVGPNPGDTLRIIEREVGDGEWQRWWVRRQGMNNTITLTKLDTLNNPLNENYAYERVPQNYHSSIPEEEGGVLFFDESTLLLGNIMVDGRVSICCGSEGDGWPGSILVDGDIKYSDVDYDTDPPSLPPETRERPCGLGIFASNNIYITDTRWESYGIPCAPDTMVLSGQVMSQQGVFRGLYDYLPTYISHWDRKFDLVGGIASFETPELSRAYGQRAYTFDNNLTRVKLPALPRIVYLYPGSWRILPMN
jgi:hypothetical protein